MYLGKKVLAVVPARGGSKGIPLKNIKKLNGLPLIAYTAKIISELDFVDYSLVSTDSDKIGTISETFNLSFPFKRPPKISGDTVGDWDVLHHALIESERLNETEYDIILMLQPTSPLRLKEDVKGTIAKLIDGDYDAVWSMSIIDFKDHPLKQFNILEEKLQYYDINGKDIVARQQLQPLYQKNGAAYAFTRECLVNQKTIKGEKTGAFIIERPMISIDTEFDFNLVEYLLGRK